MAEGLIRLEREEQLARVRPLFHGWNSLMIACALQGSMGSVWTCSDQPEAAVCETGDFLFLSGSPSGGQCESLLKAFAQKKHFYIVIAQTPELHRLCGDVFGRRAAESMRYAFRTDLSAFDRAQLGKMAGAMPEGVEQKLFDRRCVQMALAEEWSRDLCSQFSSQEDYLRRGFGVAALADGCLVGGASSYIVARGGAEVEIDVRGDHRRRGIASACAAAFVLECLKRGVAPEWDAANPESAHLARKLGFREAGAYPVWLLHETANG